MAVQISIAKGTSNPTSSTGLTLGEPAFNYANNTLWLGKGAGVSPVWVGAGVCGASGGIAAGLTYQIPTLGAVKDYFSAVSSSFLGTTAAYVSSFNGRTGAVQGVSAAVAGTGISVSGATGSVTITNIGVQSFNGTTGAVTGASLGANTFTALNTFNAGISSAGGTFSALTRFTAGITTSTLYVNGGATFNSAVMANSVVNALYYAPKDGIGVAPLCLNCTEVGEGPGSITYIGDVAGAGNSTSIIVDDTLSQITINAYGGINHVGTFQSAIAAPAFSDDYSSIKTYKTTTNSTTANQTIAIVQDVFDGVDVIHPACEVTISAIDTVLNKSEMLKMLVVQDGTNTVNTQYGLIRTGATGPVSSYSTILSVSGGGKNLLIRATPLSTNSTSFITTVRAHSV